MADKAIVKSLHSSGGKYQCGLNNDADLVINGRFASPAVDKKARLFDDFFGDLLADEWAVVEGADTATSNALIVNEPDCPGALHLITGDSSTLTYAGNGIQVTSGAFYNWKAANGGLRFETRIKISAITTTAFFVGFTDVGTFEAPIESAGSANTLTTNATDAVGFMFDTRMTDDNIWLVGVANDVDATAVDSAIAPVADTFITLAFEVNADGDATFYINGAAVGRVADAVTASVALTPTIAATSLVESSTRTVTCDYIEVEMDRV